eukprot:2313943-Prymnesium_polylepis.1
MVVRHKESRSVTGSTTAAHVSAAHKATLIVEMLCAHTSEWREVLQSRHVPMRGRESGEGLRGFH